MLGMLLSGCVTLEDRQRAAAEDRVSYRIKSGDSLYSIAWRFGLDAAEVAQWNRISHPYKIYPGQLIFLSPVKFHNRQPAQRQPIKERQTTRVKPVAPYTPKPAATKKNQPKPDQPKPPETRSSTSNPAATTSPVAVEPPAKAKPLKIKKVQWQWPLRMNHKSSKIFQSATSRGVQVKGQPGQSVFAAADGKVVYSGNNLKGYGELIIIKHNDVLISAYAHNRKRFAPEGLWVKRGQKIAELGVKAGEENAVLYFEIRKYGKSVDPLVYLPAL